MSIDHLLQPRYKVIALFPGSKRQIGDVILFQDLPGWPTKEYYEDYPHLFKILKWHEDRQPEEMPRYIKWTNPATKEVRYYKVSQWLSNSCGVYNADVEDAYLFVKDIFPATAEEYTQVITTKNA